MENLYEIYRHHQQVCTDTRNIVPGCLFFCLKGEHFDGNQFVQQALEAGAAYVVTENEDFQGHPNCIVVPDTLRALQDLAHEYRKRLTISVIGITGTNGKTTTKELIATVLRTKYKVACTQGNFNNHIGVPLTLLSIPLDAEIAIVEMGANHVGEIAELCKIVEPTHGVITNIGKAHLEGFGSYDNIIKTKSALFKSVISNYGTLFLNGGDDVVQCCAGIYPHQVAYGNCPHSVCVGFIEKMDPYLSVRIADYVFSTHLTGEYNLNNILCAIAVGDYFNIDKVTAAQAISNYQPTNHRSQIEHVGEHIVIADYYNANPTSMEAALRNLAHLSHPHKVAILGDMLELGDSSHEEHQRMIAICKEANFETYLVGEQFTEVSDGTFPTFPNVEALNVFFKSHPLSAAMILVKGSRGIHLEQVHIL